MANMIEIFLYSYVFLIGIFIGSFLNVVIYRIPKKESIVFGRSHCMTCNTQIKNRDLVPIFSYLFLKGQCRACKSKISPRYASIELATGITFLATFLINGLNAESCVMAFFSAILISITMIDFDTLTIPDEFIVIIAILTIPFYFVQDGISIKSRILGFFIISVPMFVITMIIGGAFGGGDIKLIAVCGSLLGAKNVSLAMFIAIMVAGVYAMYLMATKKAGKGTQIPFGPYICLGCYIAMLYGTPIIDWYLGQF